uniref:Signal peptide peptidase-like 2B n=1 Tax=Pogona vitticeps TaxID=103695 RepID=A0A6J0TG52_9SAUR
MENCEMPKKTMVLLASLFLLLPLPVLAQSPGVIRVSPEKGGDYCFLFPSQWTKSHHKGNKNPWFVLQPLTENLTYSAMCCLPSFFGEEDHDKGGLSSRIASVREGNCNFFEGARLHVINRTHGLLTLGGDAPYPMRSWRSGHSWGHCEEITVPGALLNDVDILYLLLKHLIRDLLYKTGIIYLMSMGIVTIGSYWAGCTEKKKQQHSKSQTGDFGEITIDTNIYFTGIYTVSATFMLFALCCFYDFLAYAMIGLFCLYASISLYYCLAPFMKKFPFGDRIIHLPYFHKDLAVRTLLLVVLCTSVSTIWVIFRNEEEWAWVLQDLLGMSIGIYILRTVYMPTLKNCSLLLLAHLLFDTVCLFIAPLLTQIGRSVTDVTAFGSSGSEKIPFLLKVPMLSTTSILDGSSFASVGLGDIVLPGFLVAYCRRFDVRVDSTGIYFLASILAYSYGLLVNFVAATVLQASQSTLPYLVPCILIATLAVAASRKEMILFWKGMGTGEDSSNYSLHKVIKHPNGSINADGQVCQRGREKEIVNITFCKEDLTGDSTFAEESPDLKTHPGEITDCIPSHEGSISQQDAYKKEEA